MRTGYLLFIAALAACGSPTGNGPAAAAGNKWSDARLAPALDAQDHRDTKALLILLQDSSAAVRQAAAMALASVQDATARTALVAATRDKQPAVRLAATWALSFIADSASFSAVAAHGWSALDTASAALLDRAVMRMLHSTGPALSVKDRIEAFYLRKARGYLRVCMADALRRLPIEQLLPEERRYIGLVQAERDPYVKMLLLGGMKHFGDTTAQRTVAGLLNDPDPVIRVAALRTHAAMRGHSAASDLLEATNDSFPAVRATAVELLQGFDHVDGEACWTAGQGNADVMVKIPLYGLAVKYGDEGTRNVASALLKSLWQQPADPYVRAALIHARAAAVPSDSLLAWMKMPWPAVERQAAFAAAIAQARTGTPNTPKADALAAIAKAAFATGDAGLIAAAADELMQEDPPVIASVLDAATLQTAMAQLHPIRDLETRQVLEQLEAKRDGRPAPTHRAPAFNHPIDRARLATLQQGKQYRIATTKGEIVIAIEPDAAPGTCTAFDSLVNAGFYNGKYYHRVVPDFVAQGGCPRGDGYGAMDWTLRTEVGLKGFEAGAVGIASAGRDTESCQFFIMLAPAPHLDGRYTRFAHVVHGLEVAQHLVVGDRITSVVPVQ